MKALAITTAAIVVGAAALVAFNTTSNTPGFAAYEKAIAPQATNGAWELDRSHSSIGFSVEHMMINETTGKFRKFSGTMTSEKEDFSDAKINFTVDATSIDTEDEARDGHLKGEDFFDTAKNPNLTFVSTGMKGIGGNKYILSGNLTMRGVTKPVDFAVIYSGTKKDPWGNTKAGFKASTTVDRTKYGLTWNKAIEGGNIVGENVTINVNVEFKKL